MNSLIRSWENNTSIELLIAAGVALSFLLIIYLIKKIVLKKLVDFTARTAARWDDALVGAAKATSLWLMLFPAILIGCQSLEIVPKLYTLIQNLAMGALFLQAGFWVSRLLDSMIKQSGARAMETNPATATTLSALNLLGQILLWVIIVLMMLDNFGVNVTTMIAGLGVGGIAIALAVQNILGDLLASLSIVIDKPFVLGDFIIIDEYMGTVEHIGIKTTRIRSLGGEQIIFANNDLLKSRVRNYKRMFERRVLFGFGVTYQTPIDQLDKISKKVKEIIEIKEKTRFERAHFAKLNTSSLDFEVVYWVLDADYNLYMDLQQSINMEIMQMLAEWKIDFAYPTQVVQIDGPIEIKRPKMHAENNDHSQVTEDNSEPEKT